MNMRLKQPAQRGVTNTSTLLTSIAVMAIAGGVLFGYVTIHTPASEVSRELESANLAAAHSSLPETIHNEEEAPVTEQAAEGDATASAEMIQEAEAQQTTNADVVPDNTTTQDTSFYTTAPLSWESIHEDTVPTLVNILCGSSAQSPISGATGTGVIIDSRGIILTNAHVAQYVLLQDHPTARTACVIRTGSPARAAYTAELIAFPHAWAAKHAADIRLEYPTGTGEDDWALLRITGTTDGSPLPESFPFLPIDTRQAVAQTDDSVLLAAYPAGFLGSISLQKDLWPVATITTIQHLYTFSEQLVDILSLGGTIVAQGGASGGATVNHWGKLVGIIVTSSVGDTTDERDLRAVTMSHINSSILKETGLSLQEYLDSGNFSEKASEFSTHSTPELLGFYTF